MSEPRPRSRNGVGTCWLTTLIISSGVTPLAASEPTKAPALVPTYTSNWLTVRFTASRSRARRAPISYTPPVKPPPPRTSAVRERRGRRRFGFPALFRSFEDGFSSRTTSPMGREYYRSGDVVSVFSAPDAPNRPARHSPARPPARGRGRPGPGADGEAAHHADGLRRGICGGLRGRCERAGAAA